MFQVSSGPVAIVASTPKTFVDLATPATNVARVTKWWVGSDNVTAGSATSAFRVQVGLFTVAVTAHTAATIDKFDGADANIASQITAGIATTTEGGGTFVVGEEHVLPLAQSEFIVWEPVPRLIPASSFWRIRIIPPAGIGATNIYAGVAWTE